MSGYLIASMLGLFLQLALVIVGAALAGALIAGLLQSMIHVRDGSIAFAAKLGATGAVVWLFGAKFAGAVTAFAIRLWGGADLYQP